MNFDANTLSALMQMLSAQKPPSGNSREPQQSDMSQGNANERYNYARYSDGNKYGNERGYVSQSVFAMQNGLGEQVDISGKERNDKTNSSSQSAQNANPMASLLSMMSGNAAGAGASGDMMSAFMPMLLNMMSGKQAASAPKSQTASAKNSGEQNNNSDAHISDEEELKKYKKMFDEMLKKEQESLKNENAADTKKEAQKDCDSDLRKFDSGYKKTQPMHEDKFAPIAFAGYTLISALNRLYAAKRAV